MSEYTPGPWRVFEQEIADRDEAKRELCRMVDGTPNFQPVLIYVTDDEWDLAPAVTGCGERSKANARLIAAAPDLLEALGDLIEDAEKQMANPSHHMPFSLQKAKAAIAKVENRS